MGLNTEAGLQGGVQGAQIGAQFGGAHGALIGGAIGLGIGLFSKDHEKKAIERYNAEVVKNATQTMFDMRRVQNIQNMRTAQALSAYQDTSRVAKSTYNASYGAADIIGSSADALMDTVRLQTDQAVAGEWFNFNTGVENFNTSIDALTNQATAQFKRAKGGQSQTGNMLTQAAGLYGQFKGQGGAGATGTIADGSYVPSGVPTSPSLSNTLNFGM